MAHPATWHTPPHGNLTALQRIDPNLSRVGPNCAALWPAASWPTRSIRCIACSCHVASTNLEVLSLKKPKSKSESLKTPTIVVSYFLVGSNLSRL
ncbi:hypothetical protein CARUB_v10007842mg [Capsella rubella]|uniref:Uncharacterized protein n=1 Tax=Capsella rubella TaxID=81985 RepID=R0H3A6_9BRAS|nr:hypothetical protein CARUB_v10007842mg [Capsella rubella]